MEKALRYLEKIDFKEENGLVLCDSFEAVRYDAERLQVATVAKKLGAKAILFRRFYDLDGEYKNSKPSVYIFDDEELLNLNGTKATELHAKIWSAGEVEVYMIVGKTELKIINARRPAEIKDNALSLDGLKLWADALENFNDQRFSAHIFGKGMFWEQEDFGSEKAKLFYKNRLKEENTPFHQLLDYLLETRKTIKIVNQKTTDRLIIICVLIKFLEGIQDDDGKHTLKAIYRDLDVNNLEEALEKDLDSFFSILYNLAKEFNGQIFTILDDEKTEILNSNTIGLLAQFLRAKLDIKTKQFFIWEQYNFNHLPVELISSIYENFLPKQKGVVYTPPFLVNFLIDEIMPLDKPALSPNNEFKILDPSCGSGAFLVAAYKRLLDWWTIQHSTKEKLQFPDKEVCQTLLEKNIFGVDIEPTATLITIFSLTTTLLNKLTPKEIWNGLKFNDLRENIQTQNFFEWASTVSKDFDLVVGNPPFNKENQTANANIKLTEQQVTKLNLKHYNKEGNKFALLFFEGAMALGKKTCLIIPSNVLLYNKNAQEYRKDIFTDFTVHKIFDFTHLRRILFGNAEVPVCAIISENKKSEQKPIEHTIIHRIETTEKKIAFQIDHYDRHFVRWDWATDETKQFIWKTNLLGGGSLFHLIYRLSLLENLDSFIKQRSTTDNEWIFNIGYIVGKSKKKYDAPHIYMKESIITETFLEDGTFKTRIETEDKCSEPRKPLLFEPPLLIIKCLIGKKNIPIAFLDSAIRFKDRIVGLHAPKIYREDLQKIYFNLKYNFKSLYHLILLAISAETLINKENTFSKEDLLILPFPENEEYLQLSETEKIIQNDVLEYYRHLGKSVNGDAKKLYTKVTQAQLEEFGEIFCNTMNEEHDHAEENRAWQIGNVYETDSFVAYQFIFGEIQNNSIFEVRKTDLQHLQNLVFNTEENSSAIFVRVLRYYGSNEEYDFVWLIKPNTMRYWFNSIALRDADDTFTDYFEIGY